MNDKPNAAAWHRHEAARFTALIDGVTDWDAPTPVAEWKARDIVTHLLTWPAGMFGSYGVELPAADLDDLAGSFAAQSAAIQTILDDPAQAGAIVQTHTGPQSVAEVFNSFYIADLFMHHWDLAKASGQDATMDAEIAGGMLAGMSQIEQMLRDSGQFGARQPVSEDASVADQFIAFIGRDPNWSPEL